MIGIKLHAHTWCATVCQMSNANLCAQCVWCVMIQECYFTCAIGSWAGI